MTKSTTPITDAASMSLASIRNSTASRYAYFVPSEVARGLELEMNKRGNDEDKPEKNIMRKPPKGWRFVKTGEKLLKTDSMETPGYPPQFYGHAVTEQYGGWYYIRRVPKKRVKKKGNK